MCVCVCERLLHLSKFVDSLVFKILLSVQILLHFSNLLIEIGNLLLIAVRL